jgi:hypothetical protein
MSLCSAWEAPEAGRLHQRNFATLHVTRHIDGSFVTVKDRKLRLECGLFVARGTQGQRR